MAKTPLYSTAVEQFRTNALINGDMRVDQIGLLPVASVSGTKYYIDRWRTHQFVVTASASLETTNQPLTGSSSLKYTATSTGTGQFGAAQPIENRGLLEGELVTLGVWVKSNSINARLIIEDGPNVFSNAHTGSGEWEFLTATGTLQSTLGFLVADVYLVSPTGGSVVISSTDENGSGQAAFIEFTGAKLELGSIATEFESPDLTLETIRSTPVNYANVNPNILINGDMRVNQRGLLPIAAQQIKYYMDRWRSLVNIVTGTASLEITLQPAALFGSKSLKYTCTLGGTGYLGADQIVEEDSLYFDRPITYSIWVKSNSPNAVVALGDNIGFEAATSHTGSGNWERLTVTTTMPSATRSSISCTTRIGSLTGGNILMSHTDENGSGAAAYIEFTGAKLELGSHATEFVADSFGDSLRKCQRYCYRAKLRGYAPMLSTTAARLGLDFVISTLRSSGASISSYTILLAVHEDPATGTGVTFSDEVNWTISIDAGERIIMTRGAALASRSTISFNNGSFIVLESEL